MITRTRTARRQDQSLHQSHNSRRCSDSRPPLTHDLYVLGETKVKLWTLGVALLTLRIVNNTGYATELKLCGTGIMT